MALLQIDVTVGYLARIASVRVGSWMTSRGRLGGIARHSGAADSVERRNVLDGEWVSGGTVSKCYASEVSWLKSEGKMGFRVMGKS